MWSVTKGLTIQTQRRVFLWQGLPGFSQWEACWEGRRDQTCLVKGHRCKQRGDGYGMLREEIRERKHSRGKNERMTSRQNLKLCWRSEEQERQFNAKEFGKKEHKCYDSTKIEIKGKATCLLCLSNCDSQESVLCVCVRARISHFCICVQYCMCVYV